MVDVEVETLNVGEPSLDLGVDRMGSMKKHSRIGEQSDRTASNIVIELHKRRVNGEILLLQYRPNCLTVVKSTTNNLEKSKVFVEHGRGRSAYRPSALTEGSRPVAWGWNQTIARGSAGRVGHDLEGESRVRQPVRVKL